MPPRRTEAQVLATYQSSQNPTTMHEIRLGHDGVVYCTCTGWRMRRTCRHLVDFLSGGGGAITVSPVTAEVRARNHASQQNPVHDLPTSLHGTSAPVFQQIPKYWNVYEGGELIGKMSGESKEAVRAMLVRSAGATLPLLIERAR